MFFLLESIKLKWRSASITLQVGTVNKVGTDGDTDFHIETPLTEKKLRGLKVTPTTTALIFFKN